MLRRYEEHRVDAVVHRRLDGERLRAVMPTARDDEQEVGP
jgi:hypothetical protein